MGIEMPRELNSREVAMRLSPGAEDPVKRLLIWPADLFAFTGTLLELSGAYRCIVSPEEGSRTWPELVRQGNQFWPESDFEDTDDHQTIWVKQVKETAQAWATALAAAELLNAEAETRKHKRKTKKSARAPIGDRFSKTQRQYLRNAVPLALKKFWDELAEKMPEPGKGSYHELWSDPEGGHLLRHMIFSHAVADETFGIILGEGHTRSDANAIANRWKTRRGTLASIDTDRGRVLSKRHTPSLGLSLRSLSQHLAFHHSSIQVCYQEVRAADPFSLTNSKARDWRNPAESLNVVLFPWPYEVDPLDFREVKDPGIPSKGGFGYFRCEPEVEGESGDARDELDRALGQSLEKVLAYAKRKVGSADIVVLPETSVSHRQLNEVLEPILGRHGVKFMIAGYYHFDAERPRYSENAVSMRVLVQTPQDGGPGVYHEIGIQSKHHRWCIDSYQADRYQLDGLPRDVKAWWEMIHIRRRALHLVELDEGPVVAPLICEDLARQDPVATLLRSVGPSLVVALLADGPQLSHRWSGKYASILAEDPGSSVLCLTSLGMVRLWSARRQGTGRVVALWSQAGSPPEELELEAGSLGLLLRLKTKRRTSSPEEEVCIDGRTTPTDRLRLLSVAQLGPVLGTAENGH